MYCPQCGKELPPDSNKCNSCGTAIQNKTSSTNKGDESPKGVIEDSAQQDSKASRDSPATTKKRPILIGIGAAIVILVAVGAIYFGLQTSGFFLLGQSEETFKEALLQDKVVLSGVASNDYLNDSPYELISYEAKDIKKTSENIITVDISATIENANYLSEITLSATYYDTNQKTAEPPSGVSRGYSFKTESSTTTPKKGIDYDQQHKLEKCNAGLNDDGKSCTVSKDDSVSFWFADSSTKSTYSYIFDDSKWKFDKEDNLRSVVYKNIDGDYAAKSGDLKEFTKFTISELDPQKGTFTIGYTYSPKTKSDS